MNNKVQNFYLLNSTKHATGQQYQILVFDYKDRNVRVDLTENGYVALCCLLSTMDSLDQHDSYSHEETGKIYYGTSYRVSGDSMFHAAHRAIQYIDGKNNNNNDGDKKPTKVERKLKLVT